VGSRGVTSLLILAQPAAGDRQAAVRAASCCLPPAFACLLATYTSVSESARATPKLTPVAEYERSLAPGSLWSICGARAPATGTTFRLRRTTNDERGRCRLGRWSFVVGRGM